jgi:hypothetical protein
MVSSSQLVLLEPFRLIPPLFQVEISASTWHIASWRMLTIRYYSLHFCDTFVIAGRTRTQSEAARHSP